MLLQRTIIDQIEITSGGVIGIRFAKQIVDAADGSVKATAWHRTVVPPGTDPMEQIAVVNTNLEAMDEARVDASKDELVKMLPAVVALAHTPEKIAKYQETQVVDTV